MRVGIIGCGSIGRRHARNAIALGHRVALYDANKLLAIALEERLGDQASMTAILGWLADQSEAILICTPAYTHAAVARELRDVGYDLALFVEKPLACSVDECPVFRSWPHRTTMVGYSCRFHRLIVDAKVEHGPLTAGGRFSIACDMRTWPGAEYAGPLLELSHEIDLALWMGAPPVVAAAERANAGLKWELKLGIGFSVGLDGAATRYWRRWDGFTDGSGFSFCFTSPEEFIADGNDPYRAELRHFLERAARSEATRTPFADGERVLHVIEQAKAMATV